MNPDENPADVVDGLSVNIPTLTLEQITENTFHRNVDEISEKAIAAYGLTFDQSGQASLNEPLLRWTDFTLRYIPPVPRKILVSNQFPKTLPAEVQVGLHRIEQLLIAGENINAYQSKTLTRFNDTSGKKNQKRTDGLWAEWGIHHVHLPFNPVSPRETYSERSSWLLFLMIYDNAALFIDIKEHDEENLFSLSELVETYIRSWPEEAERFCMKGISGTNRPSSVTDAERRQLRDSGVASMLEVDGKVYIGPGLGITTAVTSTRVSLLLNKIRSYTRSLAKEVARADGQCLLAMNDIGVTSPEFELCCLAEGDLAVHEKQSGSQWRMPRQNPDGNYDFFTVWHNALMPDWAAKTVATYWTANP